MTAGNLAAFIFGAQISRDARRQHIRALQFAVPGLLVEFGALMAYLILSVSQNQKPRRSVSNGLPGGRFGGIGLSSIGFSPVD